MLRCNTVDLAVADGFAPTPMRPAHALPLVLAGTLAGALAAAPAGATDRAALPGAGRTLAAIVPAPSLTDVDAAVRKALARRDARFTDPVLSRADAAERALDCPAPADRDATRPATACATPASPEPPRLRSSTPMPGLGLAYTPRFLPGFAVTVDRAQAVWSGFVAGLGRSLGAGRGGVGGGVGGSVADGLDTTIGDPGLPGAPSGPSAPGLPSAPDVGPRVPGAPLGPQPVQPVLPAGVPDVGGLALAYDWRFDGGVDAAPIDLSASVAQNLYRWGGADAGAEVARGQTYALAIRRASLELEVAEHRLRLDPVRTFASTLDDESIRRRDVRLTWHAQHAAYGASVSESASRAAAGAPVRERAAWLEITVPVR